MKLSVGRVAAAGIVVGLLGVGGAGFAYAQSSSTSPPSTTTPNSGGGQGHTGYCPNMGQSTTPSSASQM